MIDTSKLVVGNVYSYKELCELTGTEYQRGSGKNRQLDGYGEFGFHRFFDFEKIGYGKYIIKEIYKESLPIIDNREKGNHSVYSVFIELILMHHLSKNGKSHTETFMKKDMWQMLGMINEGYVKLSEDDLYLINPLFTKFEIKDFYMRTNQKLEKITISALNNLKRRCLIEWELLTVIHTTVNGCEKWIIANDEQRKEILKAKRQVLIEFGLDSVFQVFSKNKQKAYFKAVNNILHEWYNWDYYFQKYKVIFDAKNIIKAIPQTEIDLNKALLNKEVISYLNEEALKNYNRSQEKYQKRINSAQNENELMEAINRKTLPPNYVLAQTLLADELLRIDKVRIKNEFILEQSIDLESEYDDIENYFSTHLLDMEDFTIHKTRIV